MLTETSPAAAIREAFVAARTDEDLAKASDALMDLDDVAPEELETLREARAASLLADIRVSANPCACGFGPILAEADRKIAEAIATLRARRKVSPSPDGETEGYIASRAEAAKRLDVETATIEASA
ncbi:MAG TPA: hypothetical protein VGM13_06480 [Thermoanaerobaculia bacterium]|jgi:hypothetical protein